MTVSTWLAAAPRILAEGAVIERLRREADADLDPRVLNAALLYTTSGRARLAAIYREYMTIAARCELPLIVLTPTWRANPERLTAAGLDLAETCARGMALLDELRAARGAFAPRVAIGGLLGCRGDAYRPGEALPREDAAAFHRAQADALAATGVDFLLASTLPALSEAQGMALAMAGTRRPYVLSFVLRPAGTLLDGTPLAEAVCAIDCHTRPEPLGYMANCVHPETFCSAIRAAEAQRRGTCARMLGLQANT